MTQGAPFPPHFDQMNLAGPDTSYSGGGGRVTADRTSRPNSRVYHPYQHSDVLQTSPTRGQMQGAGSPVDLSPVASSSRTLFEGSDYATSPGADSDPYRSFPNTPANTSGAMSEDLDETTLVRECVFFSGSMRVRSCGTC